MATPPCPKVYRYLVRRSRAIENRNRILLNFNELRRFSGEASMPPRNVRLLSHIERTFEVRARPEGQARNQTSIQGRELIRSNQVNY